MGARAGVGHADAQLAGLLLLLGGLGVLVDLNVKRCNQALSALTVIQKYENSLFAKSGSFKTFFFLF